MTDAKPTTKVAAGGAAGLISALIMWGITASGVSVPDEVLAFVPAVAAFIAAYLTPDHLVNLGRELRDQQRGKHEIGSHTDEVQIIPADQATSDTKADAAYSPRHAEK